MSSHHTSQRFCLRWNNHQSNLLSVFDQLLHDESFVDVTLAVEGQFLRAHKMVLSACSPYFQALFVGHPDKHPIVILKDVPYADMRSLLDFMYRGEVSVDQDRLTAFLKVAESLRIKGLTEVNEERCDLPSIASSLLSSAGFTQQTTQQQQQQQTQQQQQQSQPPLLHRIHVPTKRSIHSNSLASNPLLGSALTAPKRKRGRPRRLSGSDEHRNQSHKSSTDSEDQRHDDDSDAPSSGVHGPPDLLEVNMPEFHSPPSRLSQSDNSPPPSEDGNPILAIEDSDRKVKPEFEEPTPGTSQQESGGGGQSPKSSSQDSESKLPSVVPSEITITPSRPESSFMEKIDMMSMDVSKDESDEREDDYDDMIACSPAGSNVESPPPKSAPKPSLEVDFIQRLYNRQGRDNPMNEKILSSLAANQRLPGDLKMRNPSLPLQPSLQACDSNMDDDISQYELDSFKSMISASAFAVGSNQNQFPPNNNVNYDLAKPVDKASVRQYCTQEANNLYRCTVCAKTYTHISNFCRHFLSAHHGIKQEVPCPVCLKLFTRRDNMVTHTKQVHRITLSRNSMQPISLENLDSSDNVSYS